MPALPILLATDTVLVPPQGLFAGTVSRRVTLLSAIGSSVVCEDKVLVQYSPERIGKANFLPNVKSNYAYFLVP
jgi:hypothetical protein